MGGGLVGNNFKITIYFKQAKNRSLSSNVNTIGFNAQRFDVTIFDSAAFSLSNLRLTKCALTQNITSFKFKPDLYFKHDEEQNVLSEKGPSI